MMLTLSPLVMIWTQAFAGVAVRRTPNSLNVNSIRGEGGGGLGLCP